MENELVKVHQSIWVRFISMSLIFHSLSLIIAAVLEYLTAEILELGLFL
jgi:hypothetical protein